MKHHTSIALILVACAFCRGEDARQITPVAPPKASHRLNDGSSQEPATPRRQVVKMTITHRPFDAEDDLGYGTCQWLYPYDEPQEALAAQPQYRSVKPVFYAARLGDSEDNTFTLVIDESCGTGKGYDVLYLDTNNDNRIDEQKERRSFQLGTTRRTVPIRATFLVAAGSRSVIHTFGFSAFPYVDRKHPVEKIHANLRNGSYYVGEAIIDGRRQRIAIADLNSNGLFSDPEKNIFQGDRFFVDRGSADAHKPSDRFMASFPYGDYTRIVDKWYSIVATPDGGQVEIARAHPVLGTVAAPAPIRSVTLWSPTQKLTLGLRRGSALGVVGSYALLSVSLEARDGWGNPWQMTGSFSQDMPEVKIQEGQATQIAVGPPFRVEVQPCRSAKENSIDFKTAITGSAGGHYRLRPRGGPSPAAFEVRDRAGQTVVSASFRYG